VCFVSPPSRSKPDADSASRIRPDRSITEPLTSLPPKPRNILAAVTNLA
jgi:hypothetical protein